MKVQLVSDTHLGYSDVDSFDILRPEAELLVIAGDFVGAPNVAYRYFKMFYKEYDIPVIYVLGNHEHYGLRLSKAVEEYREALKVFPKVHLLEKNVVTLGEVNFLGTTLWSDLSDPLNALTVQNGLNDYVFITDEAGHYITAEHTHREYLASRAWLKTELSRLSGQTNVVVTHHAPCWECRDKSFQGEENRRLTHGFCNRLDTLIQENPISHWFYGHTHISLKIKISDTWVISNQAGFAREKRTSGFNRNLVLDV